MKFAPTIIVFERAKKGYKIVMNILCVKTGEYSRRLVGDISSTLR